MNSFIDEGPSFRIYYDLSGSRRKELVTGLSEILGLEPHYLGAPTFAYEVGNYQITSNGAIICPDCCTRDDAEQIIDNLKQRGFEPTGSNIMLFVVTLPKAKFDEASIARLKNLVKSKETILKAALGVRNLQIEVYKDKIYFPWFTLSGAEGEMDAYTKLIAAIGETARKQKRISPVEKPQDNMKYAMRLFLVRLGFVGNEYKQARKILLGKLSGNCSWKAGHAPQRRDTGEPNAPADNIFEIPDKLSGDIPF